MPAFQRFAQGLQRGAGKLGQLVEEQHPAVGQRDLAGPRRRATAHQRHRTGRMVRRAKRPSAEAARIETLCGQALQCRAGQRLVLGHRRQQAGQAQRQHRLAGARRADEQQAVCAGRGNLQRTLGGGLPLHVAQVRRSRRGRRRQCLGLRQRRRLFARLQRLHYLQQAVGRADVQPAHMGRGLRAFGRQHQAAGPAFTPQRHGQRQRAAHRPQLAGQRQLAGKLELGQALRIDMAVGRQDAQRDGQVEAA
jgi:hypothetical protein